MAATQANRNRSIEMKVIYAGAEWENLGDYGDGKSLLRRFDNDSFVVAETNELKEI